MTPRVLHVPLESIKNDPQLARGSRGARKIIVTELYAGREIPADTSVWSPPGSDGVSKVILMEATEMAAFSEAASQDRHYHERGTEVYVVVEGRMSIEVDSVVYKLHQGDSIIVGPGTRHLVIPSRERFVCLLVNVNCGGSTDKFICQGD